jgi:hypothetical protein
LHFNRLRYTVSEIRSIRWRGVLLMWRYRAVLALTSTLVLFMALWVETSSTLTKPRTFSLLELDRTEAPLGDFTFDRVPVAGDRFTETNALYRWTGPRTKGARVGRDRVLLTFVTGFGKNFSHRATLLVQAQVFLPDGTMMIEGYSNVPPNGPHVFKLPVIGGTGVYDNARGYIVVRDVGDGTLGRSKIDFHLTP